MEDVFDVLRRDHEEVHAMLARLTARGPQDDVHTDLAEQLVIEESKHEAAEEMHFWPSVREHVPDGERLADQGIRQEDEGKMILEQLRKTPAEDAQFEQLILAFAHAAEEHIAYEENLVWPLLRQALSPDQRDEMGQKIQAAKEAGPTRPHPHGPDTPGGLKTAGLASAVLDKARDVASNRGR
jgi:hemerythrin-like domain-containing protein